jgi:5-methylcytosine-specific restriction protein A
LIVKATEVDHVIPRALGGTDDSSNLASLCTPCHRRKSLRDGSGSLGQGAARPG